MFCDQCGNKCNPGMKFCTKCGAKLNITSATFDNQSGYQQQYNGNQPLPYAGGEKKKGGKGLIIGLIAAVIILIVGIAAVLLIFKGGNSVKKQLEMADRYLEDLDYDEAIRVYRDILDIDPKCVDAYLGLADAYIGLEDYDEAIDILETGIEKTSSGELEDRLEEVKEEREEFELENGGKGQLGEVDDEQRAENEKVFADVQDVFEKIGELCEKEQFDELFEYMQSDDYQRLLDAVADMETAYRAETSHGNVGIYEVNNEKYGNYMIYYGEYNGRAREGQGHWLGYFEQNNYHAEGTWKEDKPNGYQEVREWNSGLSETVVYRVIKGETIDGLWDGPVDWCFDRDNGEFEVFPVSFEKGKWVVLEVDENNEESPYVVSVTGGETGEERMYTDDDQKICGIIGYGE